MICWLQKDRKTTRFGNTWVLELQLKISPLISAFLFRLLHLKAIVTRQSLIAKNFIVWIDHRASGLSLWNSTILSSVNISETFSHKFFSKSKSFYLIRYWYYVIYHLIFIINPIKFQMITSAVSNNLKSA